MVIKYNKPPNPSLKPTTMEQQVARSGEGHIKKPIEQVSDRSAFIYISILKPTGIEVVDPLGKHLFSLFAHCTDDSGLHDLDVGESILEKYVLFIDEEGQVKLGQLVCI